MSESTQNFTPRLTLLTASILAVTSFVASELHAFCTRPITTVFGVNTVVTHRGGIPASPFTVTATTPGPNLDSRDCDLDGRREVFIRQAPATLNFMNACRRGVRRVRIRFDSPTNTRWEAREPSGALCAGPVFFGPGVHTVVFSCPRDCIAEVHIDGVQNQPARDVCLRRICYRCKPRFWISVAGALVAGASEASEDLPVWEVEASQLSGVATVEAQVYLDGDHEPDDEPLDSPESPPADEPVRGWSLSIVTEGLSNVSGTIDGTDAAVANDLGFHLSEIVDPGDPQNAGREGLVSVVILPQEDDVSLPPVESVHVLTITAEIGSSGLDGVVDSGRILPLSPAEPSLVGSGQPMATVVTMGIESVPPKVTGAEIRVVWTETQIIFERGDVNSDGGLDVSDVVTGFVYLFLGGDEPGCLDAADANDDEQVDVADSIFLVNKLFLGGTDIPEPADSCGTDPTFDSDLDCSAYTLCGGSDS